MLSRIATHEPLPFVPPTVITLYGGGTRSSRSRIVRIRPRLMSIFFGWSVSNHASHSAREAKRCGTGESALGARQAALAEEEGSGVAGGKVGEVGSTGSSTG